MYKNKIYKNGLMGLLFFIWFGTFGVSLFGRWNQTTAAIVVPFTSIISVVCIVHIMTKRHILLSIGLCSIYLGIISLVAIYKLAYFQYELAGKWLVVMLGVYIVIIWIVLAIKRGGEVKNPKKPVKSALGIGLAVYPLVRIGAKFLKEKHMGDINSVAIPILIACLTFFVIGSIVGARNVFLKEDVT
ncbi:MAG: hypothetical protein E7401_03150 [Ruminococcaceae bacterium]|nr:hypothetical protein [Oscillospiraceae bacterium]